MTDIEERLQRIVSRAVVLPPGTQLPPNTPLLKAGVSLDSVAILQIVMAIEDEFAVVLDETDLSEAELESLETLAACVRRALQKAAAS